MTTVIILQKVVSLLSIIMQHKNVSYHPSQQYLYQLSSQILTAIKLFYNNCFILTQHNTIYHCTLSSLGKRLSLFHFSPQSSTISIYVHYSCQFIIACSTSPLLQFIIQFSAHHVRPQTISAKYPCLSSLPHH